jgi:hypothetical protein
MLVGHQNFGSLFEDCIDNQFISDHFACCAQKVENDHAASLPS